ncbi:ankyrin repeat domain-containing protein [Siminovitchia sp. FSL H7-0308]|uniref:Ankyrin repeat protein n=2 Tax=Bacillaceae TaxID=186817 RepID=A0ABS2R6I7_9BACI|nr:ankyrin repeat protein [Siminovitchia thermophila]
MKKEESLTLQEQLFLATEQGDRQQIQQLLKKGADVNGQDAKGRTPAMIATYNADTDTVKVLIHEGADVNIQDDMKNNPFLYAGAEGYLDILQLTIKAGADPSLTNRYGGTALIPAAEHGYTDVIKELLEKTDIDVNHVNNLGWTALLEAIILNDGDVKQQETIRMLIQHGADVRIADKDGVTPLQHARKKGFKEIEEILIEAGA